MSLKITNATMARVENSFKQLASAAQALHGASDDLSKVIRHLDASLKKLSLGVTAWVPVSGLSDETQYWTNELGYAKTDGKWGLALREVTGFHLDNGDDSEQVWGFNEAPRAQRAEAVDKIPDLLEKLLQQTHDATRELKEKIEQASEFNAVVSELTPNTTPPAPQQWQRPAVGGEGAVRRSEPEAQAAPRPAAPRLREAEPLPAERQPAAAAPQQAARLRDPEARPSGPVATAAGSAPATPRPLPAERVL